MGEKSFAIIELTAMIDIYVQNDRSYIPTTCLSFEKQGYLIYKSNIGKKYRVNIRLNYIYNY